MKSLKLEKILKRLEKLDVREWTVEQVTYNKTSISAETNGIMFYLSKEDVTALTYTYYLSIKHAGDNFDLIKYSNKEGDKATKRLVKDFYNKIYTKIEEHKLKMLEEKLNSFLSE